MTMKVFSMFSGVGGFELGLQRAGVDHELVGYCEWDKYASQIYDLGSVLIPLAVSY